MGQRCEEGAFTGAVGKAGLLEAAARGTILLDEIAEMPPRRRGYDQGCVLHWISEVSGAS